MSNKATHQLRELAKRTRQAQRQQARATKARRYAIHDSAYKALAGGAK